MRRGRLPVPAAPQPPRPHAGRGAELHSQRATGPEEPGRAARGAPLPPPSALAAPPRPAGARLGASLMQAPCSARRFSWAGPAAWIATWPSTQASWKATGTRACGPSARWPRSSLPSPDRGVSGRRTCWNSCWQQTPISNSERRLAKGRLLAAGARRVPNRWLQLWTLRNEDDQRCPRLPAALGTPGRVCFMSSRTAAHLRWSRSTRSCTTTAGKAPPRLAARAQSAPASPAHSATCVSTQAIACGVRCPTPRRSRVLQVQGAAGAHRGRRV